MKHHDQEHRQSTKRLDFRKDAALCRFLGRGGLRGLVAPAAHSRHPPTPPAAIRGTRIVAGAGSERTERPETFQTENGTPVRARSSASSTPSAASTSFRPSAVTSNTA